MGIWEEVKNNFKSGLIVVIPFIILLIIIQTIFNSALILIDPVVKGLGLEEILAGTLIAQLIGVVFLVILTILIGVLKRYGAGKGLPDPFESLIDVIPAFGMIYNSMRRMGEALSGEGTQYEKAVLVEYPREDIYQIGFMTGKAPEVGKDIDESLYSVFVPFSPNMTNGNLIFVEEDEMTDLNIEVSEAIEMSISLGAADLEEEE